MSCPSSIRHRDSNPRPLDLEPPPITTRPGLPPIKHFFRIAPNCGRSKWSNGQGLKSQHRILSVSGTMRIFSFVHLFQNKFVLSKKPENELKRGWGWPHLITSTFMLQESTELWKDMGQLLDVATFSDVAIVCGDMSFACHKNILTCRWGVKLERFKIKIAGSRCSVHAKVWFSLYIVKRFWTCSGYTDCSIHIEREWSKISR